MANQSTAVTEDTFVDEATDWLQTASYHEAHKFYPELFQDPTITKQHIAGIAANDRYFLLTHILNRHDAVHPWLYERTREVERDIDDCLDLWARDHYKSTIITFAGCMQEIINDSNITIGIFSHTKGISRAFLTQMKEEMEGNDLLPYYWPDIFWDNPKKQAPRWSKETGLVVKRTSNPKESTIEAWGLVDGQPTSKHFGLLVFDDVVTLESVNTPDQIIKTTMAWELAQNLGSSKNPRHWHIGTRYNYGDTYKVLLDRGALKPRIHPATDDGTLEGNPVFLSEKVWEKKVRDSSTYTIACQQLQNPQAGSEMEFHPDNLRTYDVRPLTLNVYILFDYAGSRASTGSSKTAMAVIGVDHAMNKYFLDGACHKMDLSERWKLMKLTRRKWMNRPGIQVVKVGYERYGAQSDIQHFETMMELENEYFPIKEVNTPREGATDKDNRIRRITPDYKNWRFFVPYSGKQTEIQAQFIQQGQDHLLAKAIKRKNEEGKIYDVTEWLINAEMLFFPNSTQKDLLDAISRIYDMDAVAPQIVHDEDVLPEPEPEY